MFAFAPLHAQIPLYDVYSEVEYLESITQRAAHDYALAHARVQAIEHQRQRTQYLRQQQAILQSWYSGLAAHPSARSIPCAISWRGSAYAAEERVWREEERRRVLLARQLELQRERERARAQEAERRRAEAQRIRDQEAFLTLLRLASAGPAYGHRQADTQKPAASILRPTFSPPVSGPVPVSVNNPVDRKGKGKAVDVPAESSTSTVPPVMPSAPPKLPNFKEELEARIRNETDPDIQESLVILYSDLFDAPRVSNTYPVAGPSVPKHERYRVPVTDATPVTPTPSAPTPTDPSPAAPPATQAEPPADGADLRRTPALPPAVAEKLLKFYHARRARRLSLAEITAVEDALRKLEDAFEFPESLDFVHPVPESPSPSSSEEPGPLAYTANNTPVHAYEHALNVLLTRLDAVESNGDVAVRGRRREVVLEVERALEAVERRVEASRERERERSRERARRASVAPSKVSSADEVPAVITITAPSSPIVNASTRLPESAIAPESTTMPVDVIDSSPTAIVEDISAVPDCDPSSPHLSPAAATDNLASESVGLMATCDAHTSPLLAEADPAIPIGHPGDGTGDVAATDVTPTAADDHADPSLGAVLETEELGSGLSGSPVDVIGPLADLKQNDTLSTGPAEDADSSSEAPSMTSDANSAAFPSAAPASLSNLKVKAASSSSALPVPEVISRTESSVTDTSEATFVTADTEPESTAASEAAFVTAQASPSASVPMTRASSGASTFLLSSTPLADDESTRKRRPSNGEDELDIISKEELEAAREDSDWSDVESAL
ncbi:hypothetical protein C8Q76DRAFT_699872 [Earliella scabrosa]|nr:hypothetical protein C8Q76DRAFT_699872 [Earliella scabrosa]